MEISRGAIPQCVTQIISSWSKCGKGLEKVSPSSVKLLNHCLIWNSKLPQHFTIIWAFISLTSIKDLYQNGRAMRKIGRLFLDMRKMTEHPSNCKHLHWKVTKQCTSQAAECFWMEMDVFPLPHFGNCNNYFHIFSSSAKLCMDQFDGTWSSIKRLQNSYMTEIVVSWQSFCQSKEAETETI